MTWSVDTAVAIANLMSTITLRLTGAGWTDADPGYGVFTSTNDQGALNCVQITNCQNSGAAADATHNRYLQFQGFRSWNAGTHAGTDGSGTTFYRLYYTAADVADTLTGDLYMSVTANRLIIIFDATNGYRNWAYFGGLDSLAGTNDPTCVFLITAYTLSGTGANWATGKVLGSASTASIWTDGYPILPGVLVYGSSSAESYVLAGYAVPQGLPAYSGRPILFPILIGEGPSASTLSIARGFMDGLLFCPNAGISPGHKSTVTVDGITYLSIIPGGAGGTASTGHPITGNYNQGLAIAEV